ncbi:hypothetical protein KSF78_0007831 [Schistosoma japonicum]|nr:hypothetical protein KSF78_0007831 [Schistosoma japonicum]
MEDSFSESNHKFKTFCKVTCSCMLYTEYIDPYCSRNLFSSLCMSVVLSLSTSSSNKSENHFSFTSDNLFCIKFDDVTGARINGTLQRRQNW